MLARNQEAPKHFSPESCSREPQGNNGRHHNGTDYGLAWQKTRTRKGIKPSRSKQVPVGAVQHHRGRLLAEHVGLQSASKRTAMHNEVSDEFQTQWSATGCSQLEASNWRGQANSRQQRPSSRLHVRSTTAILKRKQAILKRNTTHDARGGCDDQAHVVQPARLHQLPRPLLVVKRRPARWNRERE